ncbi:WD40 repeat domain-containing protein [Candidatus Babeliales bacterium]|nr:WD40 repeat domain-containing protein [Candidatus Babeliales bacterium]
MKKKFLLIFLPLAAFWLPARLQAANLTGTSTLVYQNAHYVFRNFDSCTGFVRLNNGFTILAGLSATLDTFITVSSGMDLRTTGSLNVRSDLYFGTNVTFSSGGRINGRTNTIHLGTKTTLAQDSIWQFISSGTIDGHGNTLIFSPHAQLLLESNVSLTLKNMYIQTTRNSPNIPIIRCFDQKGHVTLDNVTLDLADDFPFRTGRMFFYNDVRFTGTSCFVYQSVMQSYVAPQSLLTFDPGTTLYYYPSSTNKDLIQLQDKSSGIYLKGSATTLQTTHTGMRLTKGRLWMDNKVTLSTRASTNLDAVTQIVTLSYGDAIRGLHWSNSGRYLAIVGENPLSGNHIQVYRFGNGALTLVAGATAVTSGALSVHWSPDDRYLAVGDFDSGSLQGVRIFTFSGTALTLIHRTIYATNGHLEEVRWSPNGLFLAIGGRNPTSGNELQVYRFNGISLTLAASIDYGSVIDSLAWHPSGNHIAVGGFTPTNGNELQVFRFDGVSTLTLQDSVNFGSRIERIEWSPNGLFVALVGTTPAGGHTEFEVYLFSGSTLNLVAGVSATTGSGLTWSPDGQFIALGNGGIYRFNPNSLTLLASTGYNNGRGVSWSRDGKYLAFGGIESVGHGDVDIYSVAYRFDTSTQALSNGLVFGNTALGSTSDLDVFLLAGAYVQLNGLLNYDPST